MCVFGFTNLGEVSNYVGSLLVDLAEDVEQKRLHVKVERLMVQKQLRQEAEILTWRKAGKSSHVLTDIHPVL